jgi:hypothetical protein
MATAWKRREGDERGGHDSAKVKGGGENGKEGEGVEEED